MRTGILGAIERGSDLGRQRLPTKGVDNPLVVTREVFARSILGAGKEILKQLEDALASLGQTRTDRSELKVDFSLAASAGDVAPTTGTVYVYPNTNYVCITFDLGPDVMPLFQQAERHQLNSEFERTARTLGPGLEGIYGGENHRLGLGPEGHIVLKFDVPGLNKEWWE
jgi:hypothetical protein